MDESFSLIMPIKVKPYEHQYSAFKNTALSSLPVKNSDCFLEALEAEELHCLWRWEPEKLSQA